MTRTTKIVILSALAALFAFLGWYLVKIKKEKAIFGGMSKRKFLKKLDAEFKAYRFRIMQEYLRWSPRYSELRVVTLEQEPRKGEIIVQRNYSGSWVEVNESAPEPLEWVKDIKLKAIKNGNSYEEQLNLDLEWLWEKDRPTPYNQYDDINYLIDQVYAMGVNYTDPQVKETIENHYKK